MLYQVRSFGPFYKGLSVNLTYQLLVFKLGASCWSCSPSLNKIQPCLAQTCNAEAIPHNSKTQSQINLSALTITCIKGALSYQFTYKFLRDKLYALFQQSFLMLVIVILFALPLIFFHIGNNDKKTTKDKFPLFNTYIGVLTLFQTTCRKSV